MNNFNKPLIAGFVLLCTASFLSSCINEEFSVKNLDTSITVLPELCIHTDVSYELPVSRVLSSIPESDKFVCDENGNYWIYGKTLTGESTCSYSASKTVLNSNKPFTLGNMKFAFQFPEEVFTPIYLDVFNPTDEPFSLSLTMATISESFVIGGYTIQPGNSTIIMDEAKVLDFLYKTRGQIVGLAKFALTRMNPSDENILESGNFKVKAYAPVAIMPGEELEYEYDCPILTDLADNHITLDIEVSVESRLPAEIDICLSDKAEELGFNGSISGLDTIQAGTTEEPAVTKMVWRIDNPDGLNKQIPFIVNAKIPDGRTGFAVLNKNQTVKISVNSIKFEKGIHF